MFRRFLSSRTIPIVALGAVLCLAAKPGSSEPDKAKAKRNANACAGIYKNALQLEQSAHLRQAKDLLLSCSKATCGAMVRQQCTSRYAQLESDIPSVVPLVSDENGEPRVDVQVTMDGEPITMRLDGRALPVDPGLHEFSFVVDGAAVSTQKIMIVQGQRNRPISIALGKDKHGRRVALGAVAGTPALDAKASLDKPAVDKPAAEKPEREAPPVERALPERAEADKGGAESSPSEAPPLDVKSKGGPGAMPYLLGTVGLVGLGGAGLLTYWGRKDNEQLAQCAPDCSPDSVNHIRKLYLAADVSLGVGAAALATSVIWFIASPSSKEKPPSQASYRLDVQPTPTGGFASVSGSF
jgi:hypothetical protein